MRRVATGLWLSVALVLVCHFGAGWVRAGYGGRVRLPAQSVQSLPSELAGWQAVEDRPLDKRTADMVGASDLISRIYRNPSGRTASVNVAVWTDFREGPTGLHYPDVCYPNAGWQILQTETQPFETARGSRPMRLMLMEQSAARIVTAHWYEMGDAAFFTRGEARAIQRKWWGEHELPFVVKVLVQVSAPDLDTAKPELEALAAAISTWTDQL